MNGSWLHDSHGSFLRHGAAPYSRERGALPRYKTIEFGFEFGLLAVLIFIIGINVIW